MGGEFRVNTYQNNWQRDANVVGLRDGGFVVTWSSYLNEYDDGPVATYVAAQFYDANGKRVGGEKVVRGLDGGYSATPQATQLINGNVVWTWAESVEHPNLGGDEFIAAQIFDARGNAVTNVFKVDTVASAAAVAPDVVALKNGGFAISFGVETSTETFDDVYVRTYSADGVAVGADRKLNVVSNQFDELVTKSAGLSNGNSVIIWNSEAAIEDGTDDGQNQLRATILDANGKAIRSDFGLTEHFGGAGGVWSDSENFGYAVAARVGGGFAVANLDWTPSAEDGGTKGIYFTAYDAAGNPVGERVAVYEKAIVPGDLDIARLADGSYVVAWDQQSTTSADGDDAYAVIVSAAGKPVTPVFEVGTDRFDYDGQTDLSVTALSGGGFAVAYTSESVDDDHEGIAGRVFGRGTISSDNLAVDSSNMLYGLAGNDVLRGNAFANALHGDAGNDTLDGGSGTDRLTGGTGNDAFIVDNAGDLVFEASGGGVDRVFASTSYTLQAGQEIESLQLLASTGRANLNLTGNEISQSLVGNNGNNVIDGGVGRDAMTGRGGNDTYLVDNLGDRIAEAAGGGTDTVLTRASYALAAGQEVEALQLLAVTGTARLNLNGNEFGQSVVGNNGANVLDGKGGADLLTGRGGADSFLFSTALGAGNVDRITDFAVEDTLRLSKSVFAALAPGQLAASAFKNLSAGSVDANDRILYKQATGELFYDADGSGSGAAVKFAVFDNKAALTATDFFVV